LEHNISIWANRPNAIKFQTNFTNIADRKSRRISNQVVSLQLISSFLLEGWICLALPIRARHGLGDWNYYGGQQFPITPPQQSCIISS
jgi:hypothetical protein